MAIRSLGNPSARYNAVMHKTRFVKNPLGPYGTGTGQWYGTRGVWGGGYISPTNYNTMDYITISSAGNASDFGDMTLARSAYGACSNGSRGVYGGGKGYSSNAAQNVIDYITTSSTGNATDFGDLTGNTRYPIGLCDGNTAVWCGGDSGSAQKYQYVYIATTANAQSVGQLETSRESGAGWNNATRGVLGGNVVGLDYFTFANRDGTSTDFGDLTYAQNYYNATGSTTRALFGGGTPGSPAARRYHCEYITIASTGNATDFGDLGTDYSWYEGGGVSNNTRAVFYSGNSPVSHYFTIDTTGNSTNFGSLSTARNNVRGASGDT